MSNTLLTVQLAAKEQEYTSYTAILNRLKDNNPARYQYQVTKLDPKLTQLSGDITQLRQTIDQGGRTRSAVAPSIRPSLPLRGSKRPTKPNARKSKPKTYAPGQHPNDYRFYETAMVGGTEIIVGGTEVMIKGKKVVVGGKKVIVGGHKVITRKWGKVGHSR